MAALLVGWVDDVRAGSQSDIELDMTGLTFAGEAWAQCAAACSALRAHSRCVAVTGRPPARAARRDGGQP